MFFNFFHHTTPVTWAPAGPGTAGNNIIKCKCHTPHDPDNLVANGLNGPTQSQNLTRSRYNGSVRYQGSDNFAVADAFLTDSPFQPRQQSP